MEQAVQSSTRIPVDGALAYRPMTRADIEAGLGLSRASGWNQTARDWGWFIESRRAATCAAVRNGRVVGTVAGLRYGADAGHAVLGWIALLLVDPSERRRGIGTELLQRALDLLRDVPTVMLDATPAGERLYRTLGFVEDSRLARLQRRADSPSVVANGALGLATSADLLEMAALEGRVWGLNRYALVEWLREGALDYARVARDDAQRLVGFALGRSGHDFDQIGPVVAESRDIASQLVRACLAARPRRPVILDVPDAQAGWRAWLESQGFSIQRPFTRMRRGPIASASTPSQVFATVGPEFG